MAPKRTAPPELGPDDLVQFVDSHRPALTAGDYTVTVTQTLKTPQKQQEEKKPKKPKKPKKTYLEVSQSLDFSVLGERLSLKEGDIHAVYPPAGSRGKFGHVLPHVILERSTLPWERRPLAGGEDDPTSPSWLALLLFHESEIASESEIKSQPEVASKKVTTSVGKAGDLKQKPSPGVFFPTLEDDDKKGKPGPVPRPGYWEKAQHESDRVTLLDLPWPRFRDLLPGYDDLASSAHVRRVEAAAGESERHAKGPEVAVIMGNRLPRPRPAKAGEKRPSERWVAHLVSLEGRYRAPPKEARPDLDAAPSLRRVLRLEPWLIQALATLAETGKQLVRDKKVLPEAPRRLRLSAAKTDGKTKFVTELQVGSEDWQPVDGSNLDGAALKKLSTDLLDQASYDRHQVERTGRVQFIGRVEGRNDGHPRRVRVTLFRKGFENDGLGQIAEELCPRIPPIPLGVLGPDKDIEVDLKDDKNVLLRLGGADHERLARWVLARTREALLAERAAVRQWTQESEPDASEPSETTLAKLLEHRGKIRLRPKGELETELEKRLEAELDEKTRETRERERERETKERGRDLTTEDLQRNLAKLRKELENDLGKVREEHEKKRRKELDRLHGTLERLEHKLARPLEQRIKVHGFTEPISLIVENEERLQATLARARRLPAVLFELLEAEPVFDRRGAGESPGDKVRLVSLKSWQFFCEPERGGFLEEMLRLNGGKPAASSSRRPPGERKREAVKATGDARFQLPLPPPITDGEKRHRLAGPGAETQAEPDARRRLAADAAFAEGARYLRSGYVAVPHRMRRGDRSVSWYRGPLVADSGSCPALRLPARGPDELLIYNRKLGMFDASYAAAWELGRLMALEDSGFAVRLFNWKRSHARTLAHLRQKVDHDYLPLIRDLPGTGLPDGLASWFRSLTLLEGLPFNYLVPDERLLPADSIRFFAVDSTWLECLRDGVFSIGRVLAKDHEDDKVRGKDLEPAPRLSGFLLRSAVVSDWPRLLVDAYTGVRRQSGDLALDPHPAYPKLTLERMARLGPDVLICLFSDPDRLGREVEMVDLHLPPEVLHFGLEEPGDGGDDLAKVLRDPSSGEDLFHWSWVDRRHLAEDRDEASGDPAMKERKVSYRLDRVTFENLALAGAKEEVVAALRRLTGHAFELAEKKVAKIVPAGKVDQVTPAAAAAFVGACLKEKTLDPGSAGDTPELREFLLEFAGPYRRERQDVTPIPWRDEDAHVVALARLQEQVANRMVPVSEGLRSSAADFGLQMLDSPPLARFVRPHLRPPGDGRSRAGHGGGARADE